jgi:hypothetical protein
VTKPRWVALAAAVLLAGAASLRLCGGGPAPGPGRPELRIPPPALLPPPPPPARRAQAPPPDVPSPDRLKPFLEKLGRARLLRDRRTLDALRGEVPPVFDSDFEALVPQLGDDLFVSAGVAELARLFGRRDAVPALAAVLVKPGHPFLKDVVVDSLADIGGDAAEAALLGSLRNDADDAVRVHCAAALSRFQAPEAYHALLAALRDPSPRVRASASSSLARLNVAGTLDAILRALADERDPGAQAELVVSAVAAGGDAALDAVTRVLEQQPAAAQILRSRVRARDDARYRRAYDRAFFEPGGTSIPFDATRRRIGITLEPGAGVSPREVGLLLFSAAPLDRYRTWFYLRKGDDFPSPKAYDTFGNPMDAVPYGDLEGTVFLHFKDPTTFARGVLGYTTGCHAFVQGVSLLHEFGHAFSRLGDEYADGSRDDAANLFRQATVPWLPLVASGLLPPPVRRDADFLIPSDNCYLNNNPAQSRYCPVCQLEIHARVAELAGAPLPW